MNDRDYRNQRGRRGRSYYSEDERPNWRQAEQFQDDHMRGGQDYDQGYRSGSQMGDGYARSSSDRYDDQDERYSARGASGSNRSYRTFGRDDSSSGESYGGYGASRSRFAQDRMRDFDGNDYGGQDYVTGGPGSGGGYAAGGGFGGYAGGARNDYRGRRGDDRHEHHGFFDKVAGWFGADHDHRREHHSGRGPSSYKRSDERILEDACDRLTDDWAVDARNIQVTVDEAEVTLDGTVDSRSAKRRAEDCVHDVSGVKHVQNNLRIQERDNWKRDADPNDFGTSAERPGKT